MSMSQATKTKIQRVVICLIYILTGISAILGAIDGWSLSAHTIMTVAVGGVTALAGIFGMFDVQRKARVWMGILIFIMEVVNLVLSFMPFGLSALAGSLTQAALAWLFIACV